MTIGSADFDCGKYLFTRRGKPFFTESSFVMSAYFYVLHCNTDGRETTTRQFGSKESALTALAKEVGKSLDFVAYGVRSSSHTLKRLADAAGRSGELLEDFLVTTADWGAFEPQRKLVETVRMKRSGLKGSK